MLNVLLILAKLLIHSVFKCFFKELQLYIKSMKFMKSKFSKDLYIINNN